MEQVSAPEFPDWASLPADAVGLISGKIKHVGDYVRFRAVCLPWRIASPPKPRHLPLQLPWLMLPYVANRKLKGRNKDRTKDDGVRFFYDIWESTTRKIHLPETIGKVCCASYRGWLLLMASGGSELFLLNPLTRVRVDLPRFTTPVTHIWAKEGDPPVSVGCLFRSHVGDHIITKVTFSSDLTDPGCIIMVFFERAQGIFFCRVGDPCWTIVALPLMPRAGPADAAYHNGCFYMLTNQVMFIYDLTKHKDEGVYFFSNELRKKDKFFLVGKAGLYLVAAQFKEGGGEQEGGVERVPKQRVKIYKISEGRVDFDRVTNASDTTIFCGDNSHYLAVCAHDWEVLNGASMYVEYLCSPLTRYGNYRDGNKDRYNILFAKLNGGESRPVVNGIGERPHLSPPPPAMWFQPVLV